MPDIKEIARQALRNESAALLGLVDQIDDSFDAAVELLVNCSGHVLVSGVGTTGIIGHRFAHLLCNVGCPAMFLHAGDSLHGASGAVRSEDVLVLLSKSGETSETCKLAKMVAERQTPVIALTAEPDSTLGRLSKVVLSVRTPDEIDPYGGLMGVGSSLAAGALCDALIFAVWKVKQSPQEAFIKGHPGGIIAKLEGN